MSSDPNNSSTQQQFFHLSDLFGTTPYQNTMQTADYADDLTSRFIDWVRRNTVVWDKSHPLFKSKGKHQIWKTAETELGFGDRNGIIAKRKWVALLASFRRQIERLSTGGNVTFPYFEQIKTFLPVTDINDDEGDLQETERSDSSSDLFVTQLLGDSIPKQEPAGQQGSEEGAVRAVSPAVSEPCRTRKSEEPGLDGPPSKKWSSRSYAAYVPLLPSRTPPHVNLQSVDMTPTATAHIMRQQINASDFLSNTNNASPATRAAQLPPGTFVASEGYSEFFSFIESHLKKLPIHQKYSVQGEICKYLSELSSGKEAKLI